MLGECQMEKLKAGKLVSRNWNRRKLRKRRKGFGRGFRQKYVGQKYEDEMVSVPVSAVTAGMRLILFQPSLWDLFYVWGSPNVGGVISGVKPEWRLNYGSSPQSGFWAGRDRVPQCPHESEQHQEENKKLECPKRSHEPTDGFS